MCVPLLRSPLSQRHRHSYDGSDGRISGSYRLSFPIIVGAASKHWSMRCISRVRACCLWMMKQTIIAAAPATKGTRPSREERVAVVGSFTLPSTLTGNKSDDIINKCLLLQATTTKISRPNNRPRSGSTFVKRSPRPDFHVPQLCQDNELNPATQNLNKVEHCCLCKNWVTAEIETQPLEIKPNGKN